MKNSYSRERNYEIIKTPVIYSVLTNSIVRGPHPGHLSEASLGLQNGSEASQKLILMGSYMQVASCSKNRFLQDVLNEITVFAIPWTP